MGRPRKNKVEDIQETAVVEKATTAPVEGTAEEKPVEVVEKPKKIKIEDDEEIDVQSFDSNITYWDKATDITYFWEEVGEIIAMPYSVIKNMWRNHKTYFRNF